MQTIIQLNGIMLFGDISWQFISKTLIIGLLTLFFFFLLIRTLDKENIYKFDFKNITRKIKFIKYGNAVTLVKDGVLQLDKMHIANVSIQQIYEALRTKKISNLSQVERLFLISDGEFCIYRIEDVPAEVPVQYLSKELLNKQGKA